MAVNIIRVLTGNIKQVFYTEEELKFEGRRNTSREVAAFTFIL